MNKPKNVTNITPEVKLEPNPQGDTLRFALIMFSCEIFNQVKK